MGDHDWEFGFLVGFLVMGMLAVALAFVSKSMG